MVLWYQRMAEYAVGLLLLKHFFDSDFINSTRDDSFMQLSYERNKITSLWSLRSGASVSFGPSLLADPYREHVAVPVAELHLKNPFFFRCCDCFRRGS